MKIIRKVVRGKRIAAFSNGFVLYGRNLQGKYRLEFLFDFGYGKGNQVKLYESNKRPWIRNLYLLSFLCAPFAVLILIGIIPAYLIIRYFSGLKYFVRDSGWVQDVRYFNWVNIIIILILTTWLILNIQPLRH